MWCVGALDCVILSQADVKTHGRDVSLVLAQAVAAVPLFRDVLVLTKLFAKRSGLLKDGFNSFLVR